MEPAFQFAIGTSHPSSKLQQLGIFYATYIVFHMNKHKAMLGERCSCPTTKVKNLGKK